MSEVLTVVFVTNNYTPYAGGVVSSIIAYAQAMRVQGHTVYIVTLDFDGRIENDPFVIRVPSRVTFMYKNNPMALPLHASHELHAILARLKPNVVHSHHPFLLGTSVLKICEQLDIPLVFTHHTQYDQYVHYVPFVPAGVARRIVNRVVRSYCSQAKTVIAPSVAVARMLAERNIRVPVVVLASPVLPIFQGAWQGPKLMGCSGCQLLTVSRFVPEKNISFLLDALAAMDSSRFRLTLVGYGFYQPELERYAYEHLGLSREQVSFVVRPTRQALKDLYCASDIFVFGSQSETQGIVLAEAMACGRPVVALRGPGQDDIVVDGVNGFLVDDREQMAQVLERIVKDPALFNTLQQGAFDTGKQYYADVLARRLVEIYRSVVPTAVD